MRIPIRICAYLISIPSQSHEFLSLARTDFGVYLDPSLPLAMWQFDLRLDKEFSALQRMVQCLPGGAPESTERRVDTISQFGQFSIFFLLEFHLRNPTSKARQDMPIS